MSTYKPESQLSRVNAEAAARPVVVDPRIVDVVAQALDYSKLSNGAFDITYASVGYLYDYRKHVHPSDAAIAAALPASTTARSWSTASRIRSASSSTACASISVALPRDMPSIAVSTAAGLGSSTRWSMPAATRGCSATGWASPGSSAYATRATRARSSPSSALQDEAMSTSGDYERYFEENGVRYHHILVPSTGRSPGLGAQRDDPRRHRDADGRTLETRVIFGVERGMEFIRRVPGVEAVIVDKDGKVFYSDGLAPPQ
jgi:thiamine biosynthesis lipoprotein